LTGLLRISHMVNEKTYLRYAPTLPFGLVTSPTANALFSPSGQLITPALEDVLIWDARTGTLISRWHDSTSPVSFITSHGTLYAVGHLDGSIRLWRDDALVCILNGHKTAVTALAFSPDGEQLASGGSDTDLVIWDVGAEEGIKRLRGHKDMVTGIVWIDAGYVVTSSKDCLVKVWDLKGGWCSETVIAHRSEVWYGN
jgi:U3 small nucleolar RNA-associated protein 12